MPVATCSLIEGFRRQNEKAGIKLPYPEKIAWMLFAIMIAGLMKQKKFIPASAGTLQTDSATFGVFLLSIIFILSVLSLFVIFMAGPIAERFSLK
ncbi:MAG: potassium-transporting ATPase subunit KdpA [Mucilaginibacter sp.]|nr:potassium-transporting ATPase subunit KdpA [Mucilaginibacter sp.]